MTQDPSTFWSELLAFAQATTHAVGHQLLQDSQTQIAADQKEDGSLVTNSDRWADAYIRAAIATTFPTHGVLTEEDSHIFPGTEWCWVVDPLDGTSNFARGIPLWGISLALLYRGYPIFGYVAMPTLGHDFYAFTSETQRLPSAWSQVPQGAFRNNQALHPSLAMPSATQLFSVCSRSLKAIKRPFPAKLRMMGVASYNLLSVATGSLLGAVEATPKVWDIAAVWVIVIAAKGVWVSLQTDPIFPLRSGVDYGDVAYPTLAVAHAPLVAIFQPLIELPALN